MLAPRRTGVVSTENLVHVRRVVDGATTPTSLTCDTETGHGETRRKRSTKNENPEKLVPIDTVRGSLHLKGTAAGRDFLERDMRDSDKRTAAVTGLI